MLLVAIFVLVFFLSGCQNEVPNRDLKISGIPFGLKRASIKSIDISKEAINLLIESGNIEHNVSIQPGLSKDYKFDADELEVIDRYKPDGSIRYMKFLSKGEPRVFLVKGGRGKNIFFPNLTLKPENPINKNTTESQRESVRVIISIEGQKDRILLPGETFIFCKNDVDWAFMYLYASVQKIEKNPSELDSIASESPPFLVDWVVYKK